MIRGKLLFAATLVALALSSSAALAGHHHEKAQYPLRAEEYRKSILAKVDKVKTSIDRKLERNGVSSERRKEVGKIVDAAAKDLKAELDRASADGNISREEARKIDGLAGDLRSHVRAKLAQERRAGKTKSKEKDGKPAKDAKDTKSSGFRG